MGVNIKLKDSRQSELNVQCYLCVGFTFGSKYVQIRIICSFQYSVNINTVEVEHSEIQELYSISLHMI